MRRVGDNMSGMSRRPKRRRCSRQCSARLQGRDCHTVPITERGALIGLVTMDNVGEFLMIQAAERKSSVAANRVQAVQPDHR